MGFVMFLVLWRVRDHKHAEGWLFGVYCVLAGIERFIIEFFRAKDDRFGWAFGLSMAQVIAIGIALAGVAIMTLRSRTGAGADGDLRRDGALPDVTQSAQARSRPSYPARHASTGRPLA
jgi:prolipoprotein diacylglyceryltransferase